MWCIRKRAEFGWNILYIELFCGPYYRSFHVGHQHMFQSLKGRIIHHEYKQLSNHATPHEIFQPLLIYFWVSTVVTEHLPLFGWLDSPVSRAHRDSVASEIRCAFQVDKTNRLLEKTNSAPFKVAVAQKHPETPRCCTVLKSINTFERLQLYGNCIIYTEARQGSCSIWFRRTSFTCVHK